MRVVEHPDQLEADGLPVDVLLAVHAIKTRWAVDWALRAARRPALAVVLSGTDIYAEDGTRRAWSSQELARLEQLDGLVALQPMVLKALPAALRQKAHVIWQSAEPLLREAEALSSYRFLVLGHLRSIKDPFLAAQAVLQLPEETPIRVVHGGALLDEALADQLEDEQRDNPRWTWLGELSRERVRQELAHCRALVLTSRAEGGANVISEALVARVPILATRVDGNVGLLGPDYPGFFPAGDAAALAGCMERLVSDSDWEAQLLQAGERLAARHQLRDECAAWSRFVEQL